MQEEGMKLNFYNGYAVDFDLPVSPGVNFNNTGSEKETRKSLFRKYVPKCNELGSNKLRLINTVVVPRRPRWRTSAEGFPPRWRCLSAPGLHCSSFSRVTLATVYWNRDQFCENSTTLFTVSESGVY